MKIIYVLRKIFEEAWWRFYLVFNLFLCFLKDAQFDNDERITPLESALMIWDTIEKERDKLHEEIQNLIKIQVWMPLHVYNDYFVRNWKPI